MLERLRQNPQYVQAFASLFGPDALQDAEQAVRHFSTAVATWESSDELAPFDSRYDRYLRGEYTPTPQEQVGMALFFTPGFTNCSECHQLENLPNSAGELFTNYRYENIGVPANPLLAGRGEGPSAGPDLGLAANPLLGGATAMSAGELRGRFKVPTLRNIAVTAPYMHNGVFRDLRTVLLFYNKYNTTTRQAQVNPETGQQWAAPEVAENIATDKLRSLFLTDPQIDALVAFLNMLTDQRFEN